MTAAGAPTSCPLLRERSNDMATVELRDLVQEWRRWATTANRNEEGWQSDFPQWTALLALARQSMCISQPDEETIRLLEECWVASEEDEDLLEAAKLRPECCWPVLESLAESTFAACRWQVYEAATAAGSRAQQLLRRGLNDPDAYARRRAILALARLKPSDARTLAEALVRDADPYIRQAAIEMILAVDEPTFRSTALAELAQDSAEHVRRAAMSHLMDWSTDRETQPSNRER
jgi:hypothetical protein